jgi:MOSC domain-containing protein YiiM
MKVISLNIGRTRTVNWKGKSVLTGIYKNPVPGPVELRESNFDGDGQADQSVHGGFDRAAYAYPVVHYEFWKAHYPETDFSWGMFGENLTVSGPLEDAVRIGDRFCVGSAEVVVTQPRLPCIKLAMRTGHEDIVKRFLESSRTGFYLAVSRVGSVTRGDPFELVHEEQSSLTVLEAARLYLDRDANLESLSRIVAVPALSRGWRQQFMGRMKEREIQSERA